MAHDSQGEESKVPSSGAGGPSFTIPKKNSLRRAPIRRRRITDDEDLDGEDDRQLVRRRPVRHDEQDRQQQLSHDNEDEEMQQGCLVRSRDLSPVVWQVRGYLEEADGMLEDVLGKLVHSAENASGAVVQNAKQMAGRGAEIVHSGVHQASEMMHNRVHQASEIVHNASEMVQHRVQRAEELALGVWRACHFEKLPNWLKDNEHLHFGHRPELSSFAECFRSIFRIHTETGNIWTHLIGFVAFVVVTVVFYVRPLCTTCRMDIELSEKLIFLCFFIGAILCLACSTLFHTVSCHSEVISQIFSRLDYAGIAVLIVGSIIPWLYYGFYCQFYTKLTYIISVSVLGVLTIVLTMWDRFNLPDFRVYRTLTFVGLAFVSLIPCIHYLALKGLTHSVAEASLHHMLIMGSLYLTGATFYAARIPERFLPGKCDIWFQSHQIFHVLVIAAAFVHYKGISDMAMYRLENDKECLNYWKDYSEAAARDAATLSDFEQLAVTVH